MTASIAQSYTCSATFLLVTEASVSWYEVPLLQPLTLEQAQARAHFALVVDDAVEPAALLHSNPLHPAFLTHCALQSLSVENEEKPPLLKMGLSVRFPSSGFFAYCAAASTLVAMHYCPLYSFHGPCRSLSETRCSRLLLQVISASLNTLPSVNSVVSWASASISVSLVGLYVVGALVGVHMLQLFGQHCMSSAYDEQYVVEIAHVY